MEQTLEQLKKSRERINSLFNVTFHWLKLKQQGYGMERYFLDHGCTRIGVYGAGKLGELMISELAASDKVNITCLFDRMAETQASKYTVPVLYPDQIMDVEDMDMVVVAVANDYEDIINSLLKRRIDLPILSVNRIIENLESEAWYEQYIR